MQAEADKKELDRLVQELTKEVTNSSVDRTRLEEELRSLRLVRSDNKLAVRDGGTVQARWRCSHGSVVATVSVHFRLCTCACLFAVRVASAQKTRLHETQENVAEVQAANKRLTRAVRLLHVCCLLRRPASHKPSQPYVHCLRCLCPHSWCP